MANKYYAVKNGFKTGIYNSWEECKMAVEGYSGAVYKSFKNLNDAKEFLNNITTSPTTKTLDETPDNSQDCLIAYVDGSYCDINKLYSYGVVLLTSPLKTYSRADNKPELLGYRNVAGEILGAMTSMNYAKKHGYKQIVIYYDYEGIAKWPLREWKAKKHFTQEYIKYFDRINQFIKVKFIKVVAHTGNTYNELADKLAKDAILTFQTKTTSIKKVYLDNDVKLLEATKINNGKLGMLNINFPFEDTYIKLSDIHKLFKKKCRGHKLAFKNIKELFMVLKPSFDAIVYTGKDNHDNSFTIIVEFKEVIKNGI